MAVEEKYYGHIQPTVVTDAAGGLALELIDDLG
jgi:hypothetical protein